MQGSQYPALKLPDIVDRYIPGVTKVQAAQHLEACLVCFDHYSHSSGVNMSLRDNLDEIVCIEWSHVIDDHIRRSWRDMQDATEYGASAIAILLVLHRTEYTIIERGVKGDGFDYWLLENESLDEEDPLPIGTARLEVSGILYAEKDNEIKARVREKKKQTDVSDHLGLPAVIVVVEFSRPEVHMARKDGRFTKSA
jgi:hypothetical protein